MMGKLLPQRFQPLPLDWLADLLRSSLAKCSRTAKPVNRLELLLLLLLLCSTQPNSQMASAKGEEGGGGGGMGRGGSRKEED